MEQVVKTHLANAGPDSGCARTPQRSCRLLILYKLAECDKTVIVQSYRPFFQHPTDIVQPVRGAVC